MGDEQRSELARYQIHVRESLDQRWAVWFEGMALSDGPDGSTLLSGLVRDQAALYGLLTKARDLGLTLLAVARIEG